jgi:hypothetical protein
MTGNSSSVGEGLPTHDVDLVEGPVAEDVEGHQLVRVSLLAVEHVGVRLEGREAPGLAHHPVVSSPSAVQLPQSLVALQVLRREVEAGLHRGHQGQGSHGHEQSDGGFHLGSWRANKTGLHRALRWNVRV